MIEDESRFRHPHLPENAERGAPCVEIAYMDTGELAASYAKEQQADSARRSRG